MDARLVRVLRNYCGLSQAELARKIDRSQGWLACVEAGRSRPSEDLAERMAELLRPALNRLAVDCLRQLASDIEHTETGFR